MIHLANILVAASNTVFAESLFDRLRSYGYEGRVTGSGDDALSRIKNERPDALLLGPALADMRPVDLLRKIKADPACRQVPVFAFVEGREAEAEALDAGADDSLGLPFNDDVLFARLRPLVRLATMRAEVHRRTAVASAFGLSVDEAIAEPSLEDMALLLAGPDVNDVELMLAELGDVTVCANPFEAEDQLVEHGFDAAILDPRQQTADYLDLCAHIRNNPRLFNLPVLMLDDAARLDEAEAHRRGASRVLLRPVDHKLLRAAVTSLVRRQRLRWNIREILVRTLDEPTRDALPAVYSRALFQAYLEALLEEAKKRSRHLTVIFFYVPNVEGIAEQFGEEASQHLMLQLGQWISGLLRVEDLTARFGVNEFAVVLPDTPLNEAEVVRHRITGVLAYTDFAVKDVYQPVRVWVQSASAEATAEDDVNALVTRARGELG